MIRIRIIVRVKLKNENNINFFCGRGFRHLFFFAWRPDFVQRRPVNTQVRTLSPNAWGLPHPKRPNVHISDSVGPSWTPPHKVRFQQVASNQTEARWNDGVASPCARHSAASCRPPSRSSGRWGQPTPPASAGSRPPAPSSSSVTCCRARPWPSSGWHACTIWLSGPLL